MSKDTDKQKNTKPHRFQFLGESNDNPNDLKRLQDDALRKRENFRFRLRSIEERISLWISKLAEESLRREHSHDEIVHKCIYLPLQLCEKRVLSNLEEGAQTFVVDRSNNRSNLISMEKEIMDVETKLLKLRHVTAYESEKLNFSSLENHIGEMHKTSQLESSNAFLNERRLAREFEVVAGQIARDIHAETVARKIDHRILSEKIREQITDDERRISLFKEEVSRFQLDLEKEMSERKRQDKILLEQILNTKKELQTIILKSLDRNDF